MLRAAFSERTLAPARIAAIAIHECAVAAIMVMGRVRGVRCAMLSTLEAADIVVLFLVLGLMAQRRRDRRRLRWFVGDLAARRWSRRHVVLEVARRCYALPFRRNPVFCSPIFGPLGATPSAVIELGGCCSDRSRLLILALAELDIRAYQITLYHRAGHAQHCLVEAYLQDERLIVDPTYGFFYTDANGGSLSLQDLQAGKQPIYLALRASETCGYPANTYYDFDFRASKTANWTKSATRRVAYRALRRVWGSAADRLEVPAALEWPQHLFIVIAMGCLITMHLATALLGGH